jgi:hypothetical protein
MVTMDLPPLPALRGVVERVARLRWRLGDELGQRPLVLPTAAFFPDEFRGDVASVRRLVTRMKRHAGIADIPTRTRVVGLDEEAGGCADGSCAPGRAGAHGCGSGCGAAHVEPTAPVERLVDAGDTWRIAIPAEEIRSPVVLGTNLARLLSFVFLAETLPEGQSVDPPADVTADLTGVLLGFGVLLLQGSYIYRKSCGGPSIARATKLGTGELAVATALFAKLGGHSARAAQRELDTTPATALGAARSWVDSNPALVEALRDDPARVARGDFPLSDTRPWLVRVLGRKDRAERDDGLGVDGLTEGSLPELDDLLATLPTTPRAPRATTRPVDDELKSLVAEALEESANEAP